MIITPAVKLWFKEKWVYFLAILPVLAYGLYLMFRKKPTKDITPANTAAIVLQQKIGDLRAKAALEIGRAQGKEAAVKEEVIAITAMPTATQEDRQKQLQDLADLVNRTRGR
jgi:predicted negative regulator of RcsB-dependent stress response